MDMDNKETEQTAPTMSKTTETDTPEASNVVQNVAQKVVDEVVKTATQNAFERIIDLNYWPTISTTITNRLAEDLKEKSFMTTDLELTEKQRDALGLGLEMLISEIVKNFKASVENEERTKATYEIVRREMRGIIERVLSGIGAEINRGAVINAIAVSADSKGKDFNKIELQYSKDAGDITIPTRGVFISTNCVETIRDSIKVEAVEALKSKK